MCLRLFRLLLFTLLLKASASISANAPAEANLNAAYQNKSNDVSNRVPLGIIVTGHLRTFDLPGVHNSLIDNGFKAVAGKSRYYSFWLVSLSDDTRGHTARYDYKLRQHSQLSSSIVRFLQNDAQAVSIAVYDKNDEPLQNIGFPWSQFSEFRTRFHSSLDVNTACHLSGNLATHRHLARWIPQWKKVSGGFQMLREYEAACGKVFENILRVRPDLLVLEPMPSLEHLQLQSREAAIPIGIAGMAEGGLNDHIVILPRSAGPSAYFDLVNIYTQCNTSLETFKDDGNQVSLFGWIHSPPVPLEDCVVLMHNCTMVLSTNSSWGIRFLAQI